MIMNKVLLKYSFVIVAILCMCSCASHKSIPYFQNAAEFDGSKEARHYELKVQPKDELTIFVFSGNDNDAVAPFNIRDPREPEYRDGKIEAGNRWSRIHRYLVDNNGNIDFPILGLVHVKGLTLDSINNHIRSLIMPYLQPTTDCVVNTYIENYEITVMGEVKNPNTFTISRPEINVLEALAMAGDMTI